MTCKSGYGPVVGEGNGSTADWHCLSDPEHAVPIQCGHPGRRSDPSVLPSEAEFTEQDLMRSQLLTETIEAIELLSELVTEAGESNC